MTSQATSKGHTLADLVQHDRVHTSLYTDPAIFEDEMDKVFANTWVWVAHASEIPEAGSYKTGYIGRQPVVTVRDRKQQVHVLLNRCRHRAATSSWRKSELKVTGTLRTKSGTPPGFCSCTWTANGPKCRLRSGHSPTVGF